MNFCYVCGGNDVETIRVLPTVVFWIKEYDICLKCLALQQKLSKDDYKGLDVYSDYDLDVKYLSSDRKVFPLLKLFKACDVVDKLTGDVTSKKLLLYQHRSDDWIISAKVVRKKIDVLLDD